MKRQDVRPQPFVKVLVCDRCGREAELDDADGEFHEFTSIEHRAGYGSVFGDGNDVEVDLCQHCLKVTLGSWIRVTDPFAGFSPDHHGGEFPQESETQFIARGRAAIAKSVLNGDGVPAEHVIAKLEARLVKARAELRQRQASAQHPLRPTYPAFTLGSPVVTNTALPSLDLEAGARGSIVRIHDTADLVDVEFVIDDSGTTSIKTLDAQWLNPWKLI